MVLTFLPKTFIKFVNKDIENGERMAAKKKWYEVYAPKLFGGKLIAETPSFDASKLIGRKIEANVMTLLKEYSRFFVKLFFKIDKVDDTKAYTKFTGFECMRERIYRMVQRRSRRVDLIHYVTTKDGKKLRVKIIFILIRRVNTSTKSASRAEMKKYIEDYAGKKNFEDFVIEAIKGVVQEKAKKACSKVYPIGDIEIRKVELIEEKKK